MMTLKELMSLEVGMFLSRDPTGYQRKIVKVEYPQRILLLDEHKRKAYWISFNTLGKNWH